MNLENQAAAVSPEDDFQAAFAKFSKPDDVPAEGVAAPEGGGGDDAGGAAEPVAVVEPGADADAGAADSGGGAEAPVAEGAAPAAETVTSAATDGATPSGEPGADAGAAAVETAVAAAPVAPSADDILSRLDQIVTKAAPVQPAAAAPAATEAPTEKPLYTDEEQKFLTDYEKDWSDVTRGEALRRRAENAALVEFVFTEIAKTIIPLKQMTETVAARTHATDLETKIGKYDDSLRDQVETWIGTQPDYLQGAYKQVIDEGTSDQVADLIVRFRKETGSATPVQQPTGAKGGTELSTPAKQAAEAMAPVETKRTVIEQQDDPNDYNAAFKKFSKLLDG